MEIFLPSPISGISVFPMVAVSISPTARYKKTVFDRSHPLYNSNYIMYVLYTVSTQQHQYSNIMYAIGYIVATCFDRKRSSSGQLRTFRLRYRMVVLNGIPFCLQWNIKWCIKKFLYTSFYIPL